ncbi:hypothetical protein RFI_09897 [Reticulomyxa filosa]|uniref:TRAF-type domain-containing protein n=1 Tax=Reticulomyxa filosa TaxID=46433 RepID=X6NPC8_RETFI|nr:hypothetical protein RFI_09897 [Reticulomyxa filosa]|eukprot:ETO27232.1 hypothetical protein RFI_09897 [Reticulomyxa filosa]
MSKMEDNKTNESKTEATYYFLQHTCFKNDWLLRSNGHDQIDDFICFICKGIASNPIEINCPQHQKPDEILFVGEHCLKRFLGANPNLCPVRPHEHCQYAKSRLAQRHISELKVMCPRQFEKELQACEQSYHENEKEIRCNFNGKIRELKDHLSNSCPLQLFECWFKPFGCDHKCFKSELKEHLILKMQFHFDLVIRSFGMIKQTVQLLQVYHIFCGSFF